MKTLTGYPRYLALAGTGELKRRACEAVAALSSCCCCPRQCQANRLKKKLGVCGIGRHAVVASCFPHFGEENCLRGRRGSGTIFLSGCNLRCVFCQNYEISHDCVGGNVSAQRLADQMLALQAAGCHNINWVTPSHVVPQLLEGLVLAADQGLCLPIVYNSSGYDSVATLRWLDGIVDIYMPDFKFWEPAVAGRLARASDYPEVARAAIAEMHRQVGDLVLTEDGLAVRGLLVRHLILPNDLSGTENICRWLAREISPGTYVNVMAQYHPDGDVLRSESAKRYLDMARPITIREFSRAMAQAQTAGLYRFDGVVPV